MSKIRARVDEERIERLAVVLREVFLCGVDHAFGGPGAPPPIVGVDDLETLGERRALMVQSPDDEREWGAWRSFARDQLGEIESAAREARARVVRSETYGQMRPRENETASRSGVRATRDVDAASRGKAQGSRG